MDPNAQERVHARGDTSPRAERSAFFSPQSTLRRPSAGPGLLSKLPFVRSSNEARQHQNVTDNAPTVNSSRSLGEALQQQKTRRRRGSLRKVALLGRGAQRDKKDTKPLTVDTAQAVAFVESESTRQTPIADADQESLDIRVSDLTPRPSMDGYASRASLASSSASSLGTTAPQDREPDAGHPYISTTDEEDGLQSPSSPQGHLQGLPVTTNVDSFFADRGTAVRRKSFHRTKSPLSYSGLAASAIPSSESSWDYSETSWWGWVVLSVTWFVFIIGMGSCLDVWTWAWDVGKTPYAPPELENDPTLPIVGYYPALMILTCVMAWVWVVVAWVGMKYFRHAKISGD